MIRSQNILVVGSNGVIGRDICTSLRPKNKIIAIDINYNKSDDFAKLRKKNQINIKIDVKNTAQVENLFLKLKKNRVNIDSLVFGPTLKTNDFYEPFETTAFNSWSNIIKTELDGAFNFSQQFIKSSKNKKKRNIVFLSSIYSIVTHDHRMYENTNIATILTKTKKNKKKLFSHAAYPVAKSGIVALTKYLAAYCGKKSIRVNSVSPGGVEQKGIDRKFVKNYSDKVPMNRRAKLREITNVVNFLLSPDSSYITGQNIIVDGGYTIW